VIVSRDVLEPGVAHSACIAQGTETDKEVGGARRWKSRLVKILRKGMERSRCHRDVAERPSGTTK
jgi:hypothetical protein